ncbi:hypothetical protein HCG51_08400 [Tolypothrix sp. PCC 7910]|uniref:hypothetical protein n=1 Tax=Tolypothrix sp. PCC 7910 TaxID=2099387 RepID=UPI0014278393|nr:hypothetical protein [Tolypothrix sp. PCC 7910]QIR36764.1 hypothetical protein HCG51_08400 [Tolypothrix sp. PCC 7910]
MQTLFEMVLELPRETHTVMMIPQNAVFKRGQLEGVYVIAANQYLTTVPEVTNYQSYVGTASPYNFNLFLKQR